MPFSNYGICKLEVCFYVLYSASSDLFVLFCKDWVFVVEIHHPNSPRSGYLTPVFTTKFGNVKVLYSKPIGYFWWVNLPESSQQT